MVELLIGAVCGGVIGYVLAYFAHRPARDAKGRFIKRGLF
jgi:hypothetical protein